MKVKIDDKIYDSDDHTITLILSDEDKENIKNMKNMYSKCDNFCIFNTDEFTIDEVEEWYRRMVTNVRSTFCKLC